MAERVKRSIEVETEGGGSIRVDEADNTDLVSLFVDEGGEGGNASVSVRKDRLTALLKAAHGLGAPKKRPRKSAA